VGLLTFQEKENVYDRIRKNTHVQVGSAPSRAAIALLVVSQVEETVDDGVHNSVGASEDEEEIVNPLIHLLKGAFVD